MASPVTEMMATGQPVAEITNPAIPKDSALRLAPFNVAIGLATSSNVDKDVNLLRKRMVSWLWVSAINNLLADSLPEMPTLCKTGYDSQLYLDQQGIATFDRCATYDDLQKQELADLVAMVCSRLLRGTSTF